MKRSHPPDNDRPFEKQKRSNVFLALPKKLWVEILSYVPQPYLRSVVLVNKTFHSLAPPLKRSRLFRDCHASPPLSYVQWLKENECPWDESTFYYAARHGNLENMKWLLENKCPWDERTFEAAALHGDLENMKWLLKNKCPWDFWTFAEAAIHGNLENMKWLLEKGCPWNVTTFIGAARCGNLENMKWLKKKGCPQHKLADS